MRLMGKVALVTGAGQGIGRAIALAFAKEGADIAVNAMHKETSEATVEDTRKLGRRAVSIPADVSLPDEVDRVVEKVLDTFGKIDILVNTVGGGSSFFPMLDFPLEDWERVTALNLRSAYLCSQRVGRWMA
jgi:3-oxoacyl-[acyl-carrier protein] reductase